MLQSLSIDVFLPNPLQPMRRLYPAIMMFSFAFALLAWPADASAEEKRPPNIVVYFADDLSARDLTIYGGQDIQTPAIERLAAAGMTFNRAFVASPSCAPSRAALLTGLMPARNGAEENHTFPRDGILRLPRILNDLGYQTAAFGKVAHGKSAVDYGFETIDLDKNLSDIRKNVKRFLDDRADQRPLALFVGTSDPHVPWPSETTVDAGPLKLPKKWIDTPRTRVQRSRYLQEVKDLDAYLSELRELTNQRLGTDTMFVFSSDHGAQFPFGKWTLYDEGIRVPLVITHPGKVKAGSRTDAMVSWIDLLPTMIDVAGGGLHGHLDGRSFASVLRGETDSHREQIFTTHSGDRKMNVYPSRSVRTDRYKFIHNLHPEFAFTTHIDLLVRETSGDYFKEWQTLARTDAKAKAAVDRYHGRPEFELYDLHADPEEVSNLATQKSHAAIQGQLHNALKKWMEDQGDKSTVFHRPLMLDEPQTWVPRK